MSTLFTRHRIFASILLAGCVALLSPSSYGQITSTAGSVSLTATLGESLTISATPASVSFTLVQAGTATTATPVAITTTWLLSATRSNVKLYAWFATPTAALTDGATTPNNIPSSEVFGQVTTGTPTTYTAFTQTNTVGTATGGLLLYTQALTALNRASTRTDNLGLQINLTTQAQLPAGSYTGTLNLQAQAL